MPTLTPARSPGVKPGAARPEAPSRHPPVSPPPAGGPSLSAPVGLSLVAEWTRLAPDLYLPLRATLRATLRWDTTQRLRNSPGKHAGGQRCRRVVQPWLPECVWPPPQAPACPIPRPLLSGYEEPARRHQASPQRDGPGFSCFDDWSFIPSSSARLPRWPHRQALVNTDTLLPSDFCMGRAACWQASRAFHQRATPFTTASVFPTSTIPTVKTCK